MKFNTVKSKVLLFLSILTLLGTIFCIVSCDNFLSQNYGKTTININLDLSKLIKNSRNDDTQITGYVLKLFVYDAKNYQEGDKEIEKLPLLTQTSNKVDINGTVKASLEVDIASTVIFVGKLFTLNENNIESDKPLYAGKSEVFKVQPKDNKVHLVLSRDKAEIGFEIELQEPHEHTFDEEWSTNNSHHWKWSTCEHDVVSEKAEHTFADWTTINQPNIGVNGTKERYCKVCNYKETDVIAKIPENFVLIPAGTFQMGSNAGEEYEKPVHEVTLTKDYYIGKYEITQAEYEKYYSFVENSITSDYGDGDEYPAYFVNWFDTLVYCNKRSISENLMPCYSINGTTGPDGWGEVPDSKEHKNYATWLTVTCDFHANGYRLPTEAEWEYAARAGDNTVDTLTYSGTSDVNELWGYAWYSSNSNSTTHEVGRKKANAFGLYDMSGNVMEWCWDVYTDTYDEQDNVDPTGASSGEFRVHRGSSWNNTEKYLAVSSRLERTPSGRWYDYGFRVVRSCPSTSD